MWDRPRTALNSEIIRCCSFNMWSHRNELIANLLHWFEMNLLILPIIVYISYGSKVWMVTKRKYTIYDISAGNYFWFGLVFNRVWFDDSYTAKSKFIYVGWYLYITWSLDSFQTGSKHGVLYGKGQKTIKQSKGNIVFFNPFIKKKE